ncbi:hypothetical protein F7734_35490 [Scytonema sp. UIC 10036]|uniref:hypothetical protein n=1 Tax=Scytonema sp. UIC 10036 TaxID=2304196 RepID=UPI0012DA4F3C|nr:hypothetical protein [Scytonema sp. UIC 10036]MUG97349.1 hypothetical protein [Scytonema sp. UIC 10036]
MKFWLTSYDSFKTYLVEYVQIVTREKLMMETVKSGKPGKAGVEAIAAYRVLSSLTGIVNFSF